MNGTQAAIRALFDQLRADRLAGRNTAGFVSGYQGSPLGGLDKELARRKDEREELAITFQPGLNEELAATSVWGSQLAYLAPEASVEGVLGMWYGKNPGLDRAADAIRHANVSGVGPAGGAVALVGDDPACKSSTLPSAGERTLSGLLVPVLAPATVQEVLEFGRHAFGMSRAAGLWVALKLVADLADASATIRLDHELPEIQRLVDHTPNARLLGAASLGPERHLADFRLPAAVEYARRAGVNRVAGATDSARYGVIASGVTYALLRRALEELGLNDDRLEQIGVRILKLGLAWPLDTAAVTEFAEGLRAVLVLEDKLPFLETEVRSALLSLERHPLVLGKHGRGGERLLPSYGALSAGDIASALRVLLERDAVRLPSPPLRLVPSAGRAGNGTPLSAARTPYFCSGCPHNTSTRADPDALTGAGIGCHVMVVQDVSRRSGHVLGLTQMGGEGAQWIGIAPFTARRHFTQNVGDGTFHHSASLAIRAAIAARVNITYKLLYNDAVAMTGGQRVEGLLAVDELTTLLAAEGVTRTMITTEDPARYRGVRLAPNASVRSRDQLRQVAGELSEIAGVTVIIHDQQCAAERRRLRKRGTVPTPTQRVWINERVCEGCGDCGEKSGCLSVVPTDTEFGRKTQIDQSSCNLDFTCLSGDCPSFVTVKPGRPKAHAGEPPTAPEPERLVADDVSIRLVGIGGTGVMTVSQIVAMAAHIDGRFAEHGRPDGAQPEGRPGRLRPAAERGADRRVGARHRQRGRRAARVRRAHRGTEQHARVGRS